MEENEYYKYAGYIQGARTEHVNIKTNTDSKMFQGLNYEPTKNQHFRSLKIGLHYLKYKKKKGAQMAGQPTET
jgi:hypothetical protein